MTAPSPRPTREQVDATLRVAFDGNGDRHDARLLGAEVRALRAEAELIALHPGINTARRLLETEDEVRRLRAGLAARTPQPADPAETAQAGDRLGKAWVDAQQTVDEGGCRAVAPGRVWMCTRSAHSDGSQHVSTIGGRVVVVWGAAPLPAVPDGEDATACMNCGLPLGPPERWDQAQVGPVHHGCPAAGDDVPARLDAASELAALRAQRDAVLALHRRAEDGTFPPCCTECLYYDEDGEVRRAPWPCPTAAAAGVES